MDRLQDDAAGGGIVICKERRKKRSEKECFTCGEYGHLSRFCPEQSTAKLYIPPKRIEFKSAASIEAFKERIVAFKQESGKCADFRPHLYKPMITELLAFLSNEHRNSKRLMCGRVSVGFVKGLNGGDSGFVFAETSIVDATITFSCSSIEEKLGDETESVHVIENEYLQAWTKNSKYRKENHLFWIVFHEFCHLFVGCNNDRHDREFFETVGELAKNSSFVFESE